MARILIDSFFHMPPGHRMSRNIVVGGYVKNFGRYTHLDLYHPNGIAMLYADLLRENDVKFSTQPFSEASLCGADILIIPNPDYPLYDGTSPYRIDEHDRVALFNFMERGGSVLLLINSFYSRSDFWEENFDIERINPIFEQIGISWDTNFMSDADRILQAISGEYIVGYGQGGRVVGAKLPPDAEPILTYDGDIHGFIKPVGKGKIAVIGDAGLISNGLYNFPGFDNRAFLLNLIKKITPEFNSKPRDRFIKFNYGNVSGAPADDGITEKLFKSLRNNAEYKIDHHYRHLVWENNEGILSSDDVVKALPLDINDLENKTNFTIPLNVLSVCEDKKTKTINIDLTVVKKVLPSGIEYFVTGNDCIDGLCWNDVGANEELSKIGHSIRLSTVVQVELAVSNDGKLEFATYKQGHIIYAANPDKKKYGYDILLCSKGDVFSPAAE